jgi:hypothetical protein
MCRPVSVFSSIEHFFDISLLDALNQRQKRALPATYVPSDMVLNTIADMAKLFLEDSLNKLQVALLGRFSDRILNGSFSNPKELWSRLKTNEYMDEPQRPWGSRLLRAIIRELFLGEGEWSIERDIVDRNYLPVPTILWGLICVSLCSFHKWTRVMLSCRLTGLYTACAGPKANPNSSSWKIV